MTIDVVGAAILTDPRTTNLRERLMAINHKLHTKRARAAWPHLVALASRGAEPVTYKEISAKVGAHWRAAAWFLGVIQKYCKGARLPRLQALAVNARTRVPGGGYEGARTPKAHRNELGKVYARTWPKKAPF